MGEEDTGAKKSQHSPQGYAALLTAPSGGWKALSEASQADEKKELSSPAQPQLLSVSPHTKPAAGIFLTAMSLLTLPRLLLEHLQTRDIISPPGHLPHW